MERQAADLGPQTSDLDTNDKELRHDPKLFIFKIDD
jgi:hypothetical protein